MENILKLFTLNTTDGLMIVVGMIFFYVLWQTLRRVFFEPYIKLAEAREALTTGAKREASAKQSQADKLFEQVDERLRAARVEAMTRKLNVLTEARATASAIVESAEKEAAEALKAGREKIRADLGRSRTSSLASVRDLANSLLDTFYASRTH